MTEQDAREDLFDRAKRGEITGEQADAEAIRLGLGSLSSQPAPEDFDPTKEAHWTLPMAVAWIAYRDLGEVRNWWAAYRTECTDWYYRRWRVGFDGPIYEGWLLEERSRPTLALLGIASLYRGDDDDGEPKLIMSIKESQDALWIALREGFFEATGIDLQNQRRLPIPSIEWHELKAMQGSGEVDEVRHTLLAATGYRDVLIPSVAVRGFWLAPRKSPAQELPPLMSPDGDGYMPLFCAAQWIATKGGSIVFDPNDESYWRDAYSVLVAAMASEKVPVVGTRGNARELVPGFQFAGCEVGYPYADEPLDMMLSEIPYLRCYPYIDEPHWRKGHDDALTSRHRDHWTMLMVERNAVRERWPFTLSDLPTLPATTGFPGRPEKSRQLVVDEFQRRADTGMLGPTLRAEAQALLAWLIKTHPASLRPKPGVIENNIRDAYRSAVARTK